MDSIRDRKNFFDIAKGIGILLVVLGHSFPDENSVAGISSPLGAIIVKLIYAFHMPLFFFISGFFSTTILKNKRKVLLRIKSLLIPYLTMSIVYIPLRIIASDMALSHYSIRDIWKIIIGISPNGGMWFLYVLALCILLTGLFINKNNICALVCIFGIISLITRGNCIYIRYSVLRYFCYNFFFFILGLFIHLRYSELRDILKKVNSFILTTLFMICFIFFYLFKIEVLSSIIAVMGITLTIIVSIRIEEKSMFSKQLSTIGRDSMYLYLFHGPVQVAIRYIFWSKLHSNYLLVTMLMFFGGTILSIGGMIIIKQIKPLNYLVSGK